MVVKIALWIPVPTHLCLYIYIDAVTIALFLEHDRSVVDRSRQLLLLLRRLQVEASVFEPESLHRQMANEPTNLIPLLGIREVFCVYVSRLLVRATIAQIIEATAKTFEQHCHIDIMSSPHISQCGVFACFQYSYSSLIVLEELESHRSLEQCVEYSASRYSFFADCQRRSDDFRFRSRMGYRCLFL